MGADIGTAGAGHDLERTRLGCPAYFDFFDDMPPRGFGTPLCSGEYRNQFRATKARELRIGHNAKHCPVHGAVDGAAIVRGYEYGPGQHVVVEPDELDQDRELRSERQEGRGFEKRAASHGKLFL
jgi:hypothetical protein